MPLLPQCFRKFLALFPVSGSHDHRGTHFAQALADGSAVKTSAAGDDGDLALQRKQFFCVHTYPFNSASSFRPSSIISSATPALNRELLAS